MSNPYFSFKRFTVRHDRCAMKVGTDGVLLGAWADVAGARRILDIGTGCGLIALMLAQRSRARVTAIDIDEAAAEQARENAAASPWAERITVERADARAYRPGVRFDAVVSNPPYFAESLRCPDGRRNAARHADRLTFDELAEAAARLLAADGSFSAIVPADGAERLAEAAFRHGLHPARRTWVRTKPGAPPRRALLAFRPSPSDCAADELAVESAPGTYSPAYAALTRDFYLKM